MPGHRPALRRWIVGAIVLALPATSCANPAGTARDGPAGPLRVGVSLDVLDELRRAELEAIQARARVLNIVVQPVVANGSAADQQSQIHELLAGGHVDAIIAVPRDPARIVASIREANAAGVPFVTVDRTPAPGGSVAFAIAGEPARDGRLAGSFMLGLGRPLEVLHLWGGADDPGALERRDGFDRAVAGSPVRVVAADRGEAAAAATARALREHPNLGAVFAPSDALPAVLSTLRRAGRLAPAERRGHLVIVTVAAGPLGCQALQAGWIDADVAAPVRAFGEQAIDATHSVLRHQAIARRTVTVPGTLVSRATLGHPTADC